MTQESNTAEDLFLYSHGKLLISGEYAVLEGARALALPLQYGQSLQVHSVPSSQTTVKWQTWQLDKLLMDVTLDPANGSYSSNKSSLPVEKLLELMAVARQLNPSFLQKGYKHTAISRLIFDIQWGFGSSSSLVSNLAWWAGVDPYELNRRVFGGSGYDIACARASSPILYSLQKDHTPDVQPVGFNPPFINQLFVVYSGLKQDTRQAVADYKNRAKPAVDMLNRITEITRDMATTTRLDGFAQLMTEHEQIISQHLNAVPIQQQQFDDFEGTMKSLGAWGGDCWLVAWKGDPHDLKKYFNHKGYQTIFSLQELMLKQ